MTERERRPLGRMIRAESLKTRRRKEGRAPGRILSGSTPTTANLVGQAHSAQGQGGQQEKPIDLQPRTVSVECTVLSGRYMRRRP